MIGMLKAIPLPKVIRYSCAVLFLSVGVGCSDPDISYTVTITSIEKNDEAHYCVYMIESVGDPKLPKDYFVDDCDKYQVGETVVLKR